MMQRRFEFTTHFRQISNIPRIFLETLSCASWQSTKQPWWDSNTGIKVLALVKVGPRQQFMVWLWLPQGGLGATIRRTLNIIRRDTLCKTVWEYSNLWKRIASFFAQPKIFNPVSKTKAAKVYWPCSQVDRVCQWIFSLIKSTAPLCLFAKIIWSFANRIQHCKSPNIKNILVLSITPWVHNNSFMVEHTHTQHSRS